MFGRVTPLVSRAQSRAVLSAMKMLSDPPDVKVATAFSGARCRLRPISITSCSSARMDRNAFWPMAFSVQYIL